MAIEVCLIKKQKSHQNHNCFPPISSYFHAGVVTPYPKNICIVHLVMWKICFNFSLGLCSRNNTETYSGSGSILSYFKPELYISRKDSCSSKCAVMTTAPCSSSFKLPFPEIFVELWCYSCGGTDIWISSVLAHITHLSIWLLWWTLLMSADCIWWTD